MEQTDIFYGTVKARFGEAVDVLLADNRIVRCHVRKALSHLVVGDQVTCERTMPQPVVIKSEDRKTLLARPNARGELKAMAANVTQMCIVIAPKPVPSQHGLAAFLVAAELTGIRPVILLNKSDIAKKRFLAEWQPQLDYYESRLGIPYHWLSAHEPATMEALPNLLANDVTIFVGQSGVGKSSIIDFLLPDETVTVGALGKGTGHGQHTTTVANFFPLSGGGAIVDSPGIRQFGLWHVPHQDLMTGFPDIVDLAKQCQFTDCRHDEKAQGCAIRPAIDEGTLPKWRFEAYQALLESKPSH